MAASTTSTPALSPASTLPLNALLPLLSPQTRLLILGSFPGVASLKAQQYYSHPQNQFWRILEALLPGSRRDVYQSCYEKRSEWLLSHHLGLWDVYASCERTGSLDSNIRNPVVNDFSALKTFCPLLEAVAHNGAESFKHAKHAAALGLPAYRLPSSSPANASWPFERKLAAWRVVFEKHGLIP